MSRTVDEILNAMLTQKEQTAELSGLNSNSQTAVWRLIFYICAVAIKIVEDLFDLHIKYVDELANQSIAGTLPWYAAETRQYQHGDELIFNPSTGKLEYQVIDNDKKVVDLSAATDDATSRVFIKAAKINESTQEPEKLSFDELSGLIGYWNQKKFAGTNIEVISDDGDELAIGYNIIYDATVLNENGELLSDTSIKPVEVAINNFIKNFSVNNFAGRLLLMKLTDAIQTANGVLNAVPYLAQAGPYGQTKIDILLEINQDYITAAGYLNIDPLYPLDSYIIYKTL